MYSRQATSRHVLGHFSGVTWRVGLQIAKSVCQDSTRAVREGQCGRKLPAKLMLEGPPM